MLSLTLSHCTTTACCYCVSKHITGSPRASRALLFKPRPSTLLTISDADHTSSTAVTSTSDTATAAGAIVAAHSRSVSPVARTLAVLQQQLQLSSPTAATAATTAAAGTVSAVTAAATAAKRMLSPTALAVKAALFSATSPNNRRGASRSKQQRSAVKIQAFVRGGMVKARRRRAARARLDAAATTIQVRSSLMLSVYCCLFIQGAAAAMLYVECMLRLLGLVTTGKN
jgi:hypothetical protein